MTFRLLKYFKYTHLTYIKIIIISNGLCCLFCFWFLFCSNCIFEVPSCFDLQDRVVFQSEDHLFRLERAGSQALLPFDSRETKRSGHWVSILRHQRTISDLPVATNVPQASLYWVYLLTLWKKHASLKQTMPLDCNS